MSDALPTTPAANDAAAAVPDLRHPPLTRGGRIAGFVFILNSLLLFAGIGLGTEDKLATMSIGPALIDFLIGISLARGSAKWVALSRLRVVIGVFLWGGLLLAQGQVLDAGVQALLSTSLLLLLIGTPGRARMGIAVAIASLFFGFGVLGLVGATPLAGAILKAKGDIEPTTSPVVRGKHFDYTITLPSDAWLVRTADAAHKDNAEADRWLILPSADAHVLIIAEDADLGSVDDVTRSVMDDLRARQSADVSPATTLASHAAIARTFGAKAKVGMLDIQYVYGVFVKDHHVLQAIAFATPESFVKVEADLRKAIDSIQMP